MRLTPILLLIKAAALLCSVAYGQDPPPLAGYVPPKPAPAVTVTPVPAPAPPAATKPVVPATKHLVPRRLMYFWTTWCGNCPPTDRAINAWKRTAKAQPGEYVQYEKINGDLYPERVKQFRVDAYPTLIVTVGGREVARHEGRLSTAGDIRAFVANSRHAVFNFSESPPTSRNVLKPEFRDTERMRRHLVEDHGYTAAEVRGMTREELFSAHDEAHGEVLR